MHPPSCMWHFIWSYTKAYALSFDQSRHTILAQILLLRRINNMKPDLAKQSSVSSRAQSQEVCWQNGFLLEQIQQLMTKLQVRSHNLSCVMYSLARQFFWTYLVSCFVIKMLRAITHEGSGFFRRSNQKRELLLQDLVWHDSDRVTDYISINLLILKSNWKIKSNCGHPNQSYSAVLSFGAILMFIMRKSDL